MGTMNILSNVANRETWLLKISFEGKEDEETLLRLRDQIAKLVDPSWLGNQV